MIGRVPGTMETFVLRLWRPDGADIAAHAPAPLRGVVERLASGERHPFQTGAELILFLTAEPDDNDVGRAEKKA